MKLPRAHHLSPEALAGQLLMAKVEIDFYNRDAPAARRLLQLVKRYQVGGFLLAGGHPADVHYWTTRLQKESPIPLLLGAEWGKSFVRGTTFPTALALGAAGEASLLREFADIVIREARSMGLNFLLGPPLDLVRDYPSGPLFDAFHAQAEVAERLVAAFVETGNANGIACLGIHRPGRPTLLAPPEENGQARETLLQRLKGVWLEKESDSPPDPAFMTAIGQIRPAPGQKGDCRGVCFAAGWVDSGPAFPSLQLSLMELFEAGADVVVNPPQLPLAHRLLAEHIRRDPGFRRLAEQAVEGIFTLKKWLDPRKPAQPHPQRVYKWLEHPNHIGAAKRIAEASLTLVHRSDRFPFALPAIRRVVHLCFHGDQPSSTARPFIEALTGWFERVETVINPSPGDLPSLQPSSGYLAVVSIFSPPEKASRRPLGYKRLTAVLARVHQSGAPVAVVNFGEPALLKRVTAGRTDAVLLTFSAAPVSQEAAVKALGSLCEVRGTLPLSLPPPFSRAVSQPARSYCLQPSRSLTIDEEFLERYLLPAIEKRVFPGCAVLVARRGSILLEQGYGHFDYSQESAAVQADTIYDLSTLTTVLATTPAIMTLIERGALRLSDTLSHFYPQRLPEGKRPITIADLLCHQSGLPAGLPRAEAVEELSHAAEAILQQPLEYLPGERAVYSHLGFILLQDIVEKLSGLPLDTFCRDHLFQPLGLSELSFTPASRLKSRIPPSGGDELGPEGIAPGGVAGHAGLFGSARAVAVIGQLFIQKGIYQRRRLFQGSTVEQFCKMYRPRISGRALGWDTPPAGNPARVAFSRRTIGHSSVSGTSLWVDLRREIMVVLLSNPTDPRSGQISEVRSRLHEAVLRKLLKSK